MVLLINWKLISFLMFICNMMFLLLLILMFFRGVIMVGLVLFFCLDGSFVIGEFGVVVLVLLVILIDFEN